MGWEGLGSIEKRTKCFTAIALLSDHVKLLTKLKEGEGEEKKKQGIGLATWLRLLEHRAPIA